MPGVVGGGGGGSFVVGPGNTPLVIAGGGGGGGSSPFGGIPGGGGLTGPNGGAGGGTAGNGGPAGVGGPPGGGGGYSGGAGGSCTHVGCIGVGGTSSANTMKNVPGGGSFDAGTNQILVADFRTGNGEVVISELAAAVPEPASIALLGMSLALLATLRCRRP